MRKVIIAALVAMIAPALALAAGPQDRPDHRRQRGMGMMQELNLSADQLNQFRRLRSETRRKTIELRGKVELKTLDFHEELQKDSPDETKLNQLIGEIADLRGQMTKIRMETQVKMTRILTAEQRQRMLGRMGASMYGGHMGGRGGGMMGSGHGPDSAY